MVQKIYRFPLVGILYMLVILGLFFYSFTQVDLGLALIRYPQWFAIEQWFQKIGYFNRPLSTIFFMALLFLLHSSYLLILRLVHQKKIERRDLWGLIFFTAIVLGISYNAFSYDLFNYIFDAKIFTHYHQNPYFQKALDYPGDPMLSFMHWTHRTYPYGPVWLALTIPFSFLGFNYFLLTFFLFKSLAVVSFLGTVYFIEKTVKMFYPEHSLFSASIFAFNPLVIIESLVSAHNDVTMFFLAAGALYFLLKTEKVKSSVLLLLSIGIKFATVFLVPAFFLKMIVFKKNSLQLFDAFIYMVILSMIPAFILVVNRTNFQPWYLLYIITFISYVTKRTAYIVSSIVLSFFGLLAYIPFLYTGSWNDPNMKFFNPLIAVGISVVLIFLILDCSYRIFIFAVNRNTK